MDRTIEVQGFEEVETRGESIRSKYETVAEEVISVKNLLDARYTALSTSLGIVEKRQPASEEEKESREPLKPKPVRSGESGPRYELRNVLKIP